MKIALLGDIHVGARGDNQIIMDSQFKFFEDTFFPYLDKNGITTVVQMGDVFDRRKATTHFTLKQWRDRVFNRLNNYNVHALVGNHDSTFRNTLSCNSLNLLLGDFKNIHVVDTPIEVEFDGTWFLLLPWICDDNEKTTLEMIKSTKSSLCCGHLELSGFPMQRGHVIESGMSPSIFKRFNRVFSGHYHTSSNEGNIFYLGTPTELTWIDYDDPKGFWVYDTTSDSLDFIKNEASLFSKIMYDDKDKKFVENFDASTYKNQYVKLIVVNKKDPAHFDIVVNDLYAVGVADLKIVENLQADVDEVEVDDQTVEDTGALIDSFCDNISTELDNDKLKSLMKGLYVESLAVIE